MLLPNLMGQSPSTLWSRLAPSIQGDARFSRFNFTDLAVPYNGIDSWMEFRSHGWFEKNHIIGPTVNLIGSNMMYPGASASPIFYWQRYLQLGVGVEFYPANIWDDAEVPDYLKGIRFYIWTAGRAYYGAPKQSAYQQTESRIGLDFYYDNLFTRAPVNWSLWTDVSGRTTNFSHSDYQVFFSTGNLKIGHAYSPSSNDQRLFTYAFADWVYANGCRCRWFENSIKPGIGIAFYPIKQLKVSKQARPSSRTFQFFGFRRVNLYAEWIPHAFWLGDKAPGIVSDCDVRFGISFSTSSLLGGK